MIVCTALYLTPRAAANGHAKIVQSLLKANADAALKNGLGNTPLHWAALNGHKTVTPDQA
jgi:hypothetical protein